MAKACTCSLRQGQVLARFDYRYLGKRKTLALGVCPVTTLPRERLKRASARVLLADGVDPSIEKKQEKQRRLEAAIQTFESWRVLG